MHKHLQINTVKFKNQLTPNVGVRPCTSSIKLII